MQTMDEPMYHRLPFFFAAVALVLINPGVAQARGGRIPCLDENVIKVADVPHDRAIELASQWGFNLKRIRPGYGLDLGYRFDRCSASGQWVGYIGYREAEFDLDDYQLHALVRAAGLDELPPAPGIWKNPDIIGMMFGLPVALLFFLFRMSTGIRGRRAVA